MHYEIHRGLKSGKQLTRAQRTSGTFAPEPVVLGRVLRRGMKPMLLTETQFKSHKAQLLRLLLSGSIEIFEVDGDRSPVRLDYKTARGLNAPAVRSDSTGEGSPAPASGASKPEELEASAPPSSGQEGTPEPGDEPPSAPAEMEG